jgi:hypothetical protein
MVAAPRHLHGTLGHQQFTPLQNGLSLALQYLRGVDTLRCWMLVTFATLILARFILRQMVQKLAQQAYPE